MDGPFVLGAQEGDKAKGTVALRRRFDDGNLHAGLGAVEFLELDDLEFRLPLDQRLGQGVPGNARVQISGAEIGDVIADFVDIAEIGWLAGFEAVPQAAALQLALGELTNCGGIGVGQAYLGAQTNEVVPGFDLAGEARTDDDDCLHACHVLHVADELLLLGLMNVAFVRGEEEIASLSFFHANENRLRGPSVDDDLLPKLRFVFPGDCIDRLDHGRGTVYFERVNRVRRVVGAADPVKRPDQPGEQKDRTAERDESGGESGQHESILP